MDVGRYDTQDEQQDDSQEHSMPI